MFSPTYVQSDTARLLPNVIDRVAREHPEKPLICVPKTENLSDGFQDITYIAFANAINRAAQWLEQQLGTCRANAFETVAYIGGSDLRVPILIVAAIKTGRKIFCIGKNVSADEVLVLLEQTLAVALIHATTPRDQSRLDELGEKRASLLRLEVPDLSLWLNDSENAPQYSYNATWQDVAHHPVALFHSSGTTGIPKPIVYDNAVLASVGKDAELRSQGIELSQHSLIGRRVYCAFALNLTSGFTMAILMPIYYDYVAVIVPWRLRTLEAFDAGASTPGTTAAIMFPGLIEEIAQRPKSLEIFERLEIVWWATVPLKASLGDQLSKKVDLRMRFGSTEMFLLPFLPVGRSNWNCIRLPDWAGVEFQPRTMGLYEMVFVRQQSTPQNIFRVYPEKQVHYTKDLFSPGKEPGLWRYEGRMDDYVKLSGGQSVYVYPLEAVLQESGLVQSAIVIGHGRSKLCALLELVDLAAKTAARSTEAWNQVLAELEPIIAKADRLVPGGGVLDRDAVFFLPPHERLPMKDKGTKDRKKAETLFDKELSAMYGVLDNGIQRR